MFFTNLLLAIGPLSGAYALPSSLRSEYAVKERHIVPRDWTATGRAPRDETVHLQIGVKQRNEGVIEQHLLEISDPDHARYGKHMTTSEILDIVSPSTESVDLVKAWLQEHNVGKIAHAPSGDWLHVVIPIEKAEELLQTSYSTFEHADGHTISRAPEWSLPLHLHEHIDVIQPTTSFFRSKPRAKDWRPVLDAESHPVSWWESTGKHKYGGHRVSNHGSDPSNAAAVAAVCNDTFTTLTCLRTLYGTIDYVPKAADKNAIGITNYLNETSKRDDARQFLQTFRPEAVDAADTFNIVVINNGNNDQGPYTPEQIAAGKNVEADLDTELVLGIAYPTPLTAFTVGGSPPFIPDQTTPTDTNEPYLVWLNYVLAQDNLPQVISTSYGDSEQTVPESYAKRACAGFAQLGARGISFLVSSGDAGVGPDGECFSNTDPSVRKFLPDFPTSCPWTTSVGGTAEFNPEVAVSRFASGAGFSNYFGAPEYQRSTVNAYIAGLNGQYDGLYNKSGRAYPDVAAQGNHDAIVYAGNVRTVGGTSASSPTFAAVIALVNDALAAKGKGPLGFLNPWIYGGAYKALTDVTSGSSFGCDTDGFPAKAGWDPVTGFGTPNFGKLVDEAFKKFGGPGGYGHQ